MPETYYYWRPSFSDNIHRASNRIVLAEIGSLSMEFTRLAQVSGQHKYYDAIARITDYLEEFQNKTRLPGMWPTYLDASGCKRIDYSLLDTPLQAPLGEETSTSAAEPTETELLSPGGNKYIPLKKPDPIIFVAETGKPEKKEAGPESSLSSDPECRFLTLPVEIRQLVFSHLFEAFETVRIAARPPSTPDEDDESFSSWSTDHYSWLGARSKLRS